MSEITVFVSYSHDSESHRDRVLGLSERLRADGIGTILDRYLETGSPPEGWPRWMLNALNTATHVLCVCTETYCRRFLGHEVPTRGWGVDWEGALISQAVYEARSRTNKFIPVVFEQADEPHVPAPLRGQTHYVLASEAAYLTLYDALLDQSGIKPAAVGELRRKPRAIAQPRHFGDGPASTVPASDQHQGALTIWREKLEFLLIEEAVCLDPALKFRIKYLIAEAQDKIHSLGGEG